MPVLIAFALSTVLAIITPRDFPASAKVMPSSTNSSSGSLGALIPGAAMITQAAMQVNLYLELLKSTQVQDSVLAHYGVGLKGGAFLSSMLPSGYSASAICEAVTEAAFSSNMKSGVVTITVATTKPELSADLANTFTARLDERLQELDRTIAAKTSGYLAGQIVEQRSKLYEGETRKAEFLAKNRNYMISDDPDLRIELERLEMDVQFNRELLLTLLEVKAKNDLELEKNIPRLMVIEWATVPQPQFPLQRIKMVLLATFGAGVFAVGLVVLRAAYLWYIPPATRSELVQSCASVGVDARRVVNRIRRPLKAPERSGV